MFRRMLLPDYLAESSTRMPQWQVDDYGDIHQDIDSSLNLDSELSGGAYTNETILAINGMTVFKQEAPSPTTLNDVVHLQVAHHNRQSPTSTQQGPMVNPINSTMEENSQNVFSNTINQLLNHSALAGLQSVMDGNNLTTSTDNYTVSSTNYSLLEDCRFQYVLAAATSIATKQNEDTLTYLNQGQSYEIKLKKLGDLSMYRGKLLKSVVRICFHERRLQYMEKEQMESWQKARPGDRILEVDIPLSYGAFDISQPSSALNVISFVWDPTKEVGVYIKVNCISTEFTPKKHGGEKGVPFRIQVETYQNGDALTSNKRLHAAACQIKVFKLKGADRKHKQDREKIMKRPLAEQEKYQPSYDCTVLNDISNDAVLQTPPLPAAVPYIPGDSCPEFQKASQNNCQNNDVSQHALIPQKTIHSNPQSPEKRDESSLNSDNGVVECFTNNNQLTQFSNPDETVHWLTSNRFEKYLDVFARFSGSDMLRMSRDDLIQICGHADGIRLHNALHLKAIAPKLKLYICRENTSVFNAIFLSSHNHQELVQKLCVMSSMNPEQVKATYIEGPHSIHIQLSDDVLRHVEEETMFSLNVVHENGGYVLLLKRKVKQ
ncbi:transcription factor CP2-like protein 1 isoform X2 [Anthonomus grandis grandis]|uniref:transcription factor CP2-like protein 1 isoform X2 n=1 Tax=Anthonomus grandis grandis TaxID=2921223 RepID=UPI0021664CB6|nr:transcription factor CP2-like protein 1 isoform X2 [Anthonomus grandis grandis]